MTSPQGLDCWAARFGKTRHGLYWLTVSVGALALASLLPAAILGEGVEPSRHWTAEFVGSVIPEPPDSFVARCLWLLSPFLLIVLLLAFVDRTIKLEEDECAFQAKRYASAGVAPPCALKPPIAVRCVARISSALPPISAVLFAVSAAYLLATVAIVSGLS